MIVYKYGVPLRVATNGLTGESGGRVVRPWDVPDVVWTQLRISRRAANALVEAEHTHDRLIEDAWQAASPRIAEAVAEMEAAEQVLADARDAARKARSVRRSVAVDEGTAAAVKAAVAARRDAWEKIKTARRDAAVRSAARPGLAAATDWLRQEHKRLYALFCSTGVPPQRCRECWEPAVDEQTGVCSGCGHEWPLERLGWATFNKVLAQHKTAVDRVRKARSAGRWARLRFHPFDGTGRVVVQLQREHGPDCRCPKCVQRELDAWRVREVAGELVVSRRATGRPRHPEVPETAVASPADAAAMLAEAAGVPAAAIGLAAGGEVAPPGEPAYVPWTPVVDARALAELPGPKDPVRSPQLLASGGGKWRNVFQLTLPTVPGGYLSPREFEQASALRRAASTPLRLPSARKDPAGRRAMLAQVNRDWQRLPEGVARMRIGDDLVELPVVVHRPLPPEADVTEVQLVVRRVADQMEMHLCLTVDLPAPPPPSSGPAVALHLGWRVLPDGSVRVATWAASEPVEVPELTVALRPGERALAVRTIDSGRTGEVIVPAAWLDRATNPHRIRGERDRAFGEVRDWLADWLDQHGVVLPRYQAQPEVPGWSLRQWRSADRFAALVGRLLQDPPELPGFVAEVVPRLRDWLHGTRDQAGDRWRSRYCAHESDQLIRRRDDLWRRVGAWLATLASQVRVDDVDVASLRRRPDESTTAGDLELPGLVMDAVRARAQLAAPGGLRAAVEGAASVRGVPVAKVSVAGLGRMCPHCSHAAKRDPRWAAAAVVTCPNCGAAFDQDVATVRAMLHAVV